MYLLTTILGAVLVVLGVILIHELGHLLVAKCVGVKVLRFSIGFGKPLLSHRGRSGTEYVLAMFPLGGYVKLLDEREGEVAEADLPHAFNRQPVLARIAIVVAGPLINFLLAVVLFWIIFFSGVQLLKPIVGTLRPHSIMAVAGVKSGDEIMRIDGHRTLSWREVLMAIITRIGSHTKMQMQVRHIDSQQLRDLKVNLKHWRLNPKKPDPLKSLGIMPYRPLIPPVVGQVIESSPAAQAGIQAGDKILSIGGRPIKDWSQLLTVVSKHPNQVLSFQLRRGGKKISMAVRLGAKHQQQKRTGYLGVMVQIPELSAKYSWHTNYSLPAAGALAVGHTWQLISFNFTVLAKMIAGNISLRTLGGPITVFRSAGQASHQGWQVYLSFIGFISIALGFINLLPIPGLDGGHLLFQVIELVFRRPVSERVQMLSLRFGIIVLIFLTLQATFNDLNRLF